MARKKASELQRLLHASRKLGTITRKVCRVRTKLPVVRSTAQEKKEQCLRRLEKKTTYNAAINDAHQQIQELAREIQSCFGYRTFEWVVTNIFQSQRLKDSSKEVSRYAAFTSLQMRILNANIPEGQPRQKANQLVPVIAEKWREMTEEERVAATEDEVTAMRERRVSKELGTWHNADVSANHDSTMTVSRIKEELIRLHAHTGDEAVLVVTRGLLTRFRAPETYCTSEKSESFLSTVLKTSNEDLAMRMDAFMILGVEEQCAGKYEVKKMFYTNFDEHFTETYGIVVKNWPLKDFKNPSSITSKAEVSVLWNAWETGTAHFHMMTRTEHAAWKEEREKALAEAYGRVQEVRERRESERDTQQGLDSGGKDNMPPEGPPRTPDMCNSNLPPHESMPDPPQPNSAGPTFVHAVIVTDVNGTAVSTKSRVRKKRSDAGQPRKKKRPNGPQTSDSTADNDGNGGSGA
ncbi:MAG: hypothetical protein NXY57DRAFT_906391 [Lentinula lateritia]|nr:MAG: hypothetical protein NXY57DRAFT_906391 [Lentinula lateritia]